MTDLEMIKKCAEKMIAAGKYRVFYESGGTDDAPWVEFADGTGGDYDPLHDDAQAMALVKKFYLSIIRNDKTPDVPPHWTVTDKTWLGISPDLNRAIVECVAR